MFKEYGSRDLFHIDILHDKNTQGHIFQLMIYLFFWIKIDAVFLNHFLLCSSQFHLKSSHQIFFVNHVNVKSRRH